MEDLLAIRVLEDAAGFAREETLDATVLEDFLFPILITIDCRCLGDP